MTLPGASVPPRRHTFGVQPVGDRPLRHPASAIATIRPRSRPGTRVSQPTTSSRPASSPGAPHSSAPQSSAAPTAPPPRAHSLPARPSATTGQGPSRAQRCETTLPRLLEQPAGIDDAPAEPVELRHHDHFRLAAPERRDHLTQDRPVVGSRPDFTSSRTATSSQPRSSHAARIAPPGPSAEPDSPCSPVPRPARSRQHGKSARAHLDTTTSPAPTDQEAQATPRAPARTASQAVLANSLTKGPQEAASRGEERLGA